MVQWYYLTDNPPFIFTLLTQFIFTSSVMVEVKSRYLQAAVIVHLFRTVTTNVCSDRINTKFPPTSFGYKAFLIVCYFSSLKVKCSLFQQLFRKRNRDKDGYRKISFYIIISFTLVSTKRLHCARILVLFEVSVQSPPDRQLSKKDAF